MHPEDAEGIANSVDSDQTAPLGAVWSGSALFAQIYLSKNSSSKTLVEITFEILSLGISFQQPVKLEIIY